MEKCAIFLGNIIGGFTHFLIWQKNYQILCSDLEFFMESKRACVYGMRKKVLFRSLNKIKIVEFSIQCYQILWIHSHWIRFNLSVCVPYIIVSSLNTQLFFTLTHGLAAGCFYYFFPSWVKVFGSLPSEECEFGDGFFVYLILITMMSIQKISCLNILSKIVQCR